MNPRIRHGLVLFFAILIVIVIAEKFIGGSAKSLSGLAQGPYTWEEIYQKLPMNILFSIVLTIIILFLELKKD